MGTKKRPKTKRKSFQLVKTQLKRDKSRSGYNENQPTSTPGKKKI